MTKLLTILEISESKKIKSSKSLIRKKPLPALSKEPNSNKVNLKSLTKIWMTLLLRLKVKLNQKDKLKRNYLM
jgi:hypothetical protein